MECTFDGARIAFGPGGYARFVRCSFRNVALRDWFAFTVELVDCIFSCIFTGRLEGAFFIGTVPDQDVPIVGRTRNEFAGNDFSDMDLRDVAFRTGIDLGGPTPAGGTCVRARAGRRVGAQPRLRRSRLVDRLELRRHAMPFLTVLLDDVRAGQRQLLLRPADYPRSHRGAVDAVDAVCQLLVE